ncbi:hypothetical protein DACRYDRAFT_25301 [Dacryopinax primogenitus]|uniref:Uncharacterized protein n=1 Tax=Dacryopinax primogenitus (strain DJM 731) TaxID=1858805 RepID=M5FNC2_DACPD|nr:uncharacterized protein DACRYDRAFT_25301 [Dacryopinax primogenitus]EJT97190.1 hypothetical protein DACRYDRAFT_25301 [Dacryopinax primogenitus]
MHARVQSFLSRVHMVVVVVVALRTGGDVRFFRIIRTVFCAHPSLLRNVAHIFIRYNAKRMQPISPILIIVALILVYLAHLPLLYLQRRLHSETQFL